jgi:hypothetical protein
VQVACAHDACALGALGHSDRCGAALHELGTVPGIDRHLDGLACRRHAG